jgi:hypothetical protein
MAPRNRAFLIPRLCLGMSCTDSLLPSPLAREGPGERGQRVTKRHMLAKTDHNRGTIFLQKGASHALSNATDLHHSLIRSGRPG